MLADDFFLGVALDALCAGIPAYDYAVRVQHVNRVIADAADQQAELTLAFHDRIEGGAPFADVARDLGKALQGPFFIANRVDHHRRPKAAAILAYAPTFRFEP